MINEQPINSPMIQYWHCPNCKCQYATVYNANKVNRPLKSKPAIIEMNYELEENLSTGDTYVCILKGKCSKCDQQVEEFARGFSK